MTIAGQFDTGPGVMFSWYFDHVMV